MICTCGNDRFIGHQIIRADVIVGADGSFLENVLHGLRQGIRRTAIRRALCRRFSRRFTTAS